MPSTTSMILYVIDLYSPLSEESGIFGTTFGVKVWNALTGINFMATKWKSEFRRLKVFHFDPDGDLIDADIDDWDDVYGQSDDVNYRDVDNENVEEWDGITNISNND